MTSWTKIINRGGGRPAAAGAGASGDGLPGAALAAAVKPLTPHAGPPTPPGDKGPGDTPTSSGEKLTVPRGRRAATGGTAAVPGGRATPRGGGRAAPSGGRREVPRGRRVTSGGRRGPRVLLARWQAMRGVAADAGMSTAEYAVGTVAACAFAAVLYKVVTSSAVSAALSGMIKKALGVAF